MQVKNISLSNFKNIEECKLSFSGGINFLFGNNGMGKTNLLDALFYFSFCKSYSHLPDSQLIQYGKNFCLLNGLFITDEGSEETLQCSIQKGHKKIFKRNNKPYGRLSDHIGFIPLVMVSPSDVDLIYGGSEERRKFIDMLISQYDKNYLSLLIVYNRTLIQRNSLLKIDFQDHSLLEILNEKLVESGWEIYNKRKSFIMDFVPVFNSFYENICAGNETVDLKYDSQIIDRTSYENILFSSFESDRALGYTSKGIHKDDFEFLLNNHLIRKIGSQGQNKTYLIALKLSQFNLLSEKVGETPVLLLDDIFDKLDADRVKQIIQIVSRSKFGQIFISDTDKNYLNEIVKDADVDHRLFYVEKGSIKPI